MKKLKGFTLVELIVVMVIFSMIMIAALSLLAPITNVYHNTAVYEHARASSDNVRLYIEDNLKYADKLRVVYNVEDSAGVPSDVLSEAQALVDAYKNMSGEYGVGDSDNPLYIMKLDNVDKGKISIYKFDGAPSSVSVGTPYKQINENLYNDYEFSFSLPNTSTENPGTFGVSNASLDIHIYKYIFDRSLNTRVLEDTNYSTTATFSFVNLRETIAGGSLEEEIFLDDKGHIVPEGTPGAESIKTTGKYPYRGCDALPGSSYYFIDNQRNIIGNGEAADFNPASHMAMVPKNIYFIYTLPKFINQY